MELKADDGKQPAKDSETKSMTENEKFKQCVEAHKVLFADYRNHQWNKSCEECGTYNIVDSELKDFVQVYYSFGKFNGQYVLIAKCKFCGVIKIFDAETLIKNKEKYKNYKKPGELK